MSQTDIFNLGADVVAAEEKDSVGGFAAWETDLYEAQIKAAYLDTYDKGSKYIELVLELTDAAGNTRQHSEREIVWSANTKGPFYIDKKTGEKKELIGLSKMNSLGQLLTGKKLGQSNFENKFHKIYSKEANGEVPQERPTLVEWTGKKIFVGLQKVITNKQVKQGTTYVDTNEERTDNQVDKFFNENKATLLEVQNSVESKFHEDWLKANKGKDRNKFKAAKGAPAAGVPSATAAPLSFN